MPTRRPPCLLIKIRIAKCPNPSLRSRSKQVAFEGLRGISVDAGDFLRIHDDRHHDPLEQGVTHNEGFQIELTLPLEPQKWRKTKERIGASLCCRLNGLWSFQFRVHVPVPHWRETGIRPQNLFDIFCAREIVDQEPRLRLRDAPKGRLFDGMKFERSLHPAIRRAKRSVAVLLPAILDRAFKGDL